MSAANAVCCCPLTIEFVVDADCSSVVGHAAPTHVCDLYSDDRRALMIRIAASCL